MEAFSYMTINNFGDFYQPIKGQIHNNTNYYLDEIDYNNENIEDKKYIGYSQNIPYISKTVNKLDGYNRDEYIQIFKRNNLKNIYNYKKYANKKNSSEDFNRHNNKDKENELINIYKGKLIKLFVKFMNDFYQKKKKNIFNKLIFELNNLKNINIIKKKNNITIKDKSKLSFSHKKKDSIYKKIIKKRNINNEINNRYNNENTEMIKKSSSNFYFPAKNRISYNDYNNMVGSKTKLSIFNEIKIDKSSKLIDLDNNNDINPNKNNFYSTNYKNFYTKKSKTKINNNDLDKYLENKKIKNNLYYNIQCDNNTNITDKDNKFKKKQIIYYKKVKSQEKDNIINIKENKKQDNNIKVYQKINKKINNINNNFRNKKVMNRYTTNYKFKSNLFNSTIFKNNNLIKDKIQNKDENNINNSASANISNDNNNFCLDDKPMNIIFLKNSNTYAEDDASYRNEKEKKISNLDLFEDNIIYQLKNDDFIEIKNLRQIKTDDKKLSINCNYIALNNRNKNKKNNKKSLCNLIVSNYNSFNINGNKNIQIENGIRKLDNLLYNKISKIKNIFYNHLKMNNSIFIFNNIISKILLKFYMNSLKKNIKIKNKKVSYVSFKEINNRKEKKNSFNFLVDPKENSEFNFINPKNINKLQGKEKLRFLIKQISKSNPINITNREENNNDDNIDTNNNEDNIKISYRGDTEKIGVKKPLYNSNDIKKSNTNMKKQKSVYLKKNINQKNINNF